MAHRNLRMCSVRAGSIEDFAQRLRQVREELPQHLALRLHRAVSWLRRGELENADPDVRFILLWIAFNAAYAHDIDPEAASSERDQFAVFFARIAEHDTSGHIYDLIWKRFPHEVRLLLTNRFVYAPFWAHQNGRPGFEDWADRLARSQRAVNAALASRDTPLVLSILFDRLYTLRNQLVHGGATWSSQVNRDQVRDGAAILGELLPLFLEVMLDTPDTDWGRAYYPVVST